MDGDTNRAGDCLGRTNGGADGDRAHQHSGERCEERLLEL
jgi:hypothetical protein